MQTRYMTNSLVGENDNDADAIRTLNTLLDSYAPSRLNPNPQQHRFMVNFF